MGGEGEEQGRIQDFRKGGVVKLYSLKRGRMREGYPSSPARGTGGAL